MKKNKTVAYLMAAALLVGGTFLGTKAWFFSNKVATNDLVITTGKMDISVNQDNPWTAYDHEGKEKVNGLTNAQPGDYFKKTITLKNTGTLPQKIKVGELQPLVSVQTIKDILGPEIKELLGSGLEEQLKDKLITEIKNLLSGNKSRITIPGVGDIDLGGIEDLLNNQLNRVLSALDNLSFSNIAEDILTDDRIKFDEVLTYSLNKQGMANQLDVNGTTTFEIRSNITENYGISGEEKAVVKDAIINEISRVMSDANIDSRIQSVIIRAMNLVLRNIENPIESVMSDLFEDKTIKFEYLCEPIKVEATQINK